MTSKTAPTTCTAAEAAHLLNVNRATVTRWIQAGRLTPITKLPGLRGAYLLNTDEVHALANTATE